jgi:hypothetical protein
MRTYFRQRFARRDAALPLPTSMESVLIELIFILGPVLVALFVALQSRRRQPRSISRPASGSGRRGAASFFRGTARMENRTAAKRSAEPSRSARGTRLRTAQLPSGAVLSPRRFRRFLEIAVTLRIRDRAAGTGLAGVLAA